MSGIEERFEDIVKREQKDVGYFRNIIKENKSIQQEIKVSQGIQGFKSYSLYHCSLTIIPFLPMKETTRRSRTSSPIRGCIQS